MWPAYLAYFATGALLCNAIPHLVAGLQGHPFPTPFATPRGVGDSPPLVNTLWGIANLAGGLAVLVGHPVALAFDVPVLGVLAGAVVMGGYLSVHFGRVRQGKRPVG